MRTIWFESVAIGLLLLLNGFFSMSEMAVISSRRSRLRPLAEKGDRKASAALRLSESPDRFLSTVQIGITLIGILTGTFGGATIAAELEGVFARRPWSAPYSELLAIGLTVVPITYLTLVLGELVPKRLAISSPETLARVSAPLMSLLMRVSWPAVRFLTLSTGAVMRLFGLKPAGGPTVSEAEIRSVLGEGAKAGVLEHAEHDMIERILRLGDRQAGAMMTHRSNVVWLDLDRPWQENLSTIQQSPFSRFPVARGDISNIVGVLKAKSYLAGSRTRSGSDLELFIQQPLYVPETIRVLRLLELFKQHSSIDFAAIIDEHGDIQGIITLKDILEAIVGDIPQAGESPEPMATQRADGSWIMDARLPMDEVRSTLRMAAVEDDRKGYHTLAGFILSQLGDIPNAGSWVDAHGFRFEVMDMDGKRIDAVLITPLPEERWTPEEPPDGPMPQAGP
jgi:putative hemolysin